MSFINFKSREERLEHPHAKWIPESVWALHFKGRYCSEGRYFGPLRINDQFSYHSPEINVRVSLYISTVYADKEALVDKVKLSKLAQMLGLNERNICEIEATLPGRLDMIKNDLQARAGLGNPVVIHSEDFGVFLKATMAGNLETVEYFLKEATPSIKQSMIAHENYQAFRSACGKRHIPLAKRLLEETSPDAKESMIVANRNTNFIHACMHEDMQIIDLTYHQVSLATQKEMIEACQYSAFESAAHNGQLKVVQFLIEEVKKFEKTSPNMMRHMFKASEYAGVYISINFNYVDIVKLVFAHSTPEEISYMIDAHHNHGFERAVTCGNREMVDLLLSHMTPAARNRTICRDRYKLLLCASDTILDLLINAISMDEFVASIKDDNYSIFLEAAKSYDIRALHNLLKLVPQQLRHEMVGERNASYACIAAIQKQSIELIQALLPIHAAFKYIDNSGTKYQSLVKTFVDEQLVELEKKITQFQHQNPYTPFVLSKSDESQNEQDAHFFFNIARHLIKRNDKNVLGSIFLILNMDCMKRVVNKRNELNSLNELTFTAFQANNRSAVQLLMSIPKIRYDVARQIDEYDHIRWSIDLGQYYRDNHLLLSTFNGDAQKYLCELYTKFRPMLQKNGSAYYLNKLIDSLAEAYRKNPAQISLENGQWLILPLEYSLFRNSIYALTDNEKTLAYQAISQHTHHSAYRFLQNPNPWASKDTYHLGGIHPTISGEPLMGFEQYQDLVALLYMSVVDYFAIQNEEVFENESYVWFIEELAYMQREYNHDIYRESINKQGVSHKTYYDDLEQDKPCLGNERIQRLLQSIYGLKLFNPLTNHRFELEVKDIIKDYVKEKLISSHYGYEEYKKAMYDAYVEMDDANSKPSILDDVISTLDVIALKEKIISYLISKYQIQFNVDSRFYNKLQNVFKLKAFDRDSSLKNDKLDFEYPNLISKWYGWIHLEALLEEIKNKGSHLTKRANSALIFTKKEEADLDKDILEDNNIHETDKRALTSGHSLKTS